MAKMNVLGVGIYSATGKLIGRLPFEETRNVARKAAGEGIVVLKNEGILPVQPQAVALFGVGARDTVICGTGSGYAFSPGNVSVYDGLKKAGFTITSETYLKNYAKYKKEAEKNGEKLTFLQKRFSGITLDIDDKIITPEELTASKTADTVIYVIRRNTGETFDRKAVKGDYYLSDNEVANLNILTENFSNVIVVLNTCVIDAVRLKEDPGIKAVVVLGQAGMEAGNALADILTGKVAPSGRLTDTWAMVYSDYPASDTFSHNDGKTLLEEYTEDIFVGYRHFDKKNLEVAYPFGYGLSYTTFEYHDYDLKADWQNVCVSLKVTNTGKVASKEVVQVYVCAPSGKLNKPVKELKGYHKTKELAPGETEEVSIVIPTRELCSYDEETACWIMEKGNYLVKVGRHSRDTEVIGTVVLDETARVVQLSNNVVLDAPLEFREYPETVDHEAEGIIVRLSEKDCVTVDESSRISRTLNAYVPEDSEYESKTGNYRFPIQTAEEVHKVRKMKNATLLDVVDGKITMEEFVASLDNEILIRLVTGNGQETSYQIAPRLAKGAFRSVANGSTSGKTTDMFAASLGIPQVSLADGPAGLHLMGTPSSCFPVGMVLAQTWNPEIVYEVGDCFGREMEYFDIALILGPGMNIHRDPLCGRNFEYYAEDPLVTGKSASAFIRGLQEEHTGYGVAIKHFCCNNQEVDRQLSNSRVSERALREIYLKGFEIAVKEAKPATVMTSYNLVNGIHTSSRYDLVTDVLRGEWGFDGFVMTDWDGESDRVADLYAGNDIIMGGYMSDPLVAAMGDFKPEFNDDGTVKQKKISMYGGMMHKNVEIYNSFLPDRDGTDTVEVVVEKPNLEVLNKLKEKGLVEIKEREDGRTAIIYKGYYRANSLPLSAVQRNVMRILNFIAFGSPMKMAKRG